MSTESTLAVGIDLGTTYSAVSVVRNGTPFLLPDAGGQTLLPSVVGFDGEGRLLVGRSARNQLLVAPDRTVRSVKRSMGSDRTWTLQGRPWSATEISAVILRTLVDQAEAALGERPTSAVITVPAFFTDLQRQATKDAGEMAGLQVLRLINEPTAAALTYETDDTLALVYDLGGGTFDVSVAEMGRDFTEVRASRGDTKLGGDDIDIAFARRIAADWGHPEIEKDAVGWARLNAAAERAKIALSERTTVRLQESYLLGDVHLDRVVSREDLEEIAAPILTPTLEHMQRAMADARVIPRDVRRVLLVGGQTRMPLVRRIIEEAFEIPVFSDVEPDAAVALGAGLMAARLAGQAVDALLVDVTPHTLCTGALETPYDTTIIAIPVIPRNTVVPTTRSHLVYTRFPNQTAINVPVGQGEAPLFEDCTRIGQVRLEGLTPGTQQQPIEVRFHLDASGVLTATAIERNTGREAQTVFADSPHALTERRRAGGARAVEEALALTSEGLDAVLTVARRMLDQAASAKGGDAATLASVRDAASALEALLGGGDAEAITDATDTLADALLEMV